MSGPRHVLPYWKHRLFLVGINSISLDGWLKPLFFIVAWAIALAIVMVLGMNVDNLLRR
jgi:hypothetical protein